MTYKYRFERERPLDAVRKIVATIKERLTIKSEAAREAISDTDTDKQRAIKQYIVEHPEATQGEVAEVVATTQKHVSETVRYIFGTSSENIPQESRAKANGITDRTQRKLDKLERQHPDLFAKVQTGELTIHAASKQAGSDKTIDDLF